jgi:hypothetical protein
VVVRSLWTVHLRTLSHLPAMLCIITNPDHASSLTGVKYGLALALPWHPSVPCGRTLVRVAEGAA